MREESERIKELATSIRGLLQETISVDHEKNLVLGALYHCIMDILKIPFDYNSEDTPFRVSKMLAEKTLSLREAPPDITTFNNKGYNEYIVVKDIPYSSLCSHHHLPFYGKAHICYHPGKSVLGLSKFSRVVTHFANKPQIQEEMTSEIAKYIWDKCKPKGILVKVEGIHTCMTTRGAKAIGSITITQQIIGDIDKLEAMNMIGD